MMISGYTPSALLNSADDANDQTRSEIGVRLLKKAQDQMKQESLALLQGIEQTGSQCSSCQRLDVYA